MFKYEAVKKDDFASDDVVHNLTILGAHLCGKTSLLEKFAYGAELKEADGLPKGATGKYTIKITLSNGTTVYLRLLDPSGHENYARLKHLTIPVADYVIIAYSAGDRESFFEMKQDIYENVRRKKKVDAQVVLVCTKHDTLNEDGVSDNEGLDFYQTSGCSGFFVTSAKTNEGVVDMFEYIVDDIQSKYVDDTAETGCCFYA